MKLTGMNQLWIADITYIRLKKEFVYLAVILDAFSRKVVAGTEHWRARKSSWPFSRRRKGAILIRPFPPRDGGRRTVQGTGPQNAGEIRERVRKMSDEELLRYGAVCKSMCSPEINLDTASLDAWSVQLQEARAEWRRRHPELPLSESV